MHRELGAPIEDLFVRFDAEPIAAAVGRSSLVVEALLWLIPSTWQSIAQVHRARIRFPSGEEEVCDLLIETMIVCLIMFQEVAVKVQRPDIRRHANWDLWAYRALLRLYGEE